MEDLAHYTSYSSLVISSGYVLYKLLQAGYKADMISFLLFTPYLIIFIHGLIMMYRESVNKMNSFALKHEGTTRTLVQTVSFQFYATLLMKKYMRDEWFCYIPAVIGVILGFDIYRYDNRNDLINFSVCASAVISFVLGYLKHNYYAFAAGLASALGQIILEDYQIRFNLFSYQQFNLFVSAFSIASYMSLKI